jgi:hypothetical protein
MVKSLSVKHFATAYLSAGFGISLYENLFGELTAFAWTDSVKGNLLLLFWWLIVPSFLWPWDVFWGLFHRLF